MEQIFTLHHIVLSVCATTSTGLVYIGLRTLERSIRLWLANQAYDRRYARVLARTQSHDRAHSEASFAAAWMFGRRGNSPPGPPGTSPFVVPDQAA
jgi:hypothetical protein